MKTIVYAGTFDPITNGHVDLAERAGRLFDHVILAIAVSEKKGPLFNINERIELARKALSHLDNIEIRIIDRLLVDFVKEVGAQGVLRGLRAVSDFEYEFQLANMNRALVEQGVDVLALVPQEQTLENMFLQVAEGESRGR